MFLVFNEPSDGNIEKKLDVSSQRCDVYPAHVYVPQVNNQYDVLIFQKSI